MFVDPGDYDGLRYLIHGITAGDPMTALLQRILGPGDAFVDVGANVGLYSVVAYLCVGASGRVLALEASPTTFQRLKVITTHAPPNVEVRHCAVADKPGMLDFFVGPQEHSGVSSLRNLGAAATQQVTVRADTIDRMLAEWPKVRFVKIDVEGAELSVIQGALRTIERHRPMLAMELTPRFLAAFGHSLDELLAVVLRRGYRCRRLKQPFQEFTALAEDEFQCDVVFVPIEQDDFFLARMRSAAGQESAAG